MLTLTKYKKMVPASRNLNINGSIMCKLYKPIICYKTDICILYITSISHAIIRLVDMHGSSFVSFKSMFHGVGSHDNITYRLIPATDVTALVC